MKTVVLYTFNVYNDRVAFFVKHGIFKSDDVDFVIICNDLEFKIDTLPDYVTYINRPNIGYDFGAWSDALLNYHYVDKDYDTYIFVNSSVYGPFIRKKDKDEKDETRWTDIFCNGLTDDIKLFGVTIYSNCVDLNIFFSLINHVGIDEDEDDFKINDTLPRSFLESFVFSMTKQTLNSLIIDGIFSTVYSQNFGDAIGLESRMTRCIIAKGWNIAGTCAYYKGVDWRFTDKTTSNYPITFITNMMTQEYYEKGLINPYDIIFIKGNRGIDIKELADYL
jgi:hypothetical protein